MTVCIRQFKIETLEVPGCPEEPDTKAKITYYIPPVKPAKGRKYPAMLYVCGDGMCMANPDMFSLPELAMKFKCVIVAPHYRTILDGGKYPDALNDLHAGYQWLYEHADELGVHRYGFSPRGCVAAAPIRRGPSELPLYGACRHDVACSGGGRPCV